MAEKKTRKILVMMDGQEKEVLQETGKYYIGKDFQYRKGNLYIAEIREEKIASAPKKKSSKKKGFEEFEEGFDQIPDDVELFEEIKESK